MSLKKHLGILFAGICAGMVNGLFGAGGGMVLIPLLTIFTDLEDDAVFPSCVSIILPICVVSLFLSEFQPELTWKRLLPYLAGSALGGIAAGFWGSKIPTKWLHRILGIFILWGGIRYLC